MTDGLEAARMVDLDALRDFETIPLEETRDWRSLQWYLRGRSDERASESALRAAAQELVGARRLSERCARGVASTQEGAQLLTLLNHLKAALDGAPWEPSEEQVERAAKAIERWDADDHPYEVMARAALKAALSPPPAGPPASA